MSEWMTTQPMQSHNSPWTDAFKVDADAYDDASSDEAQSEQQPTHDALDFVYNRETSEKDT